MNWNKGFILTLNCANYDWHTNIEFLKNWNKRNTPQFLVLIQRVPNCTDFLDNGEDFSQKCHCTVSIQMAANNFYWQGTEIKHFIVFCGHLRMMVVEKASLNFVFDHVKIVFLSKYIIKYVSLSLSKTLYWA